MKPRYLQNVLLRFFVVLKEKGLKYLVIFVFNHIFSYFICKYYRIFNHDTVNYGNRNFPLFFHVHNHTWLNERMIEIPIFKYIMDQHQQGVRILEVGNVMSHYFPIHHDVVDKYETADGVLNVDVLEFATEIKYDLIISISTLEHVGFDEGAVKEPRKIFEAIDHLKGLLAKHGEMYVSVPIGENSYLDEYLRTNRIEMEKRFNYMRKGKTDWVPVNYEAVAHAQYNEPYRWGNALVILYWKKI